MSVKVTPEEVKATAAKMEAHNARINTIVNSLMSQLGALTHGWQGPAGTAFLRAHNDWTQVSAKHNAKLKLTGEALDTTSRNQQQMEQVNADGANRAGSAISAAL
ncbi:MAG: WXG100 family type VII secretion target [Pseudonocardiales bacterium]